MFGYVTINKEELKGKDYQKYQAYYCGVCQELKERFGQVQRLTLTYDMTFLAILLTGLYEDTTVREEHFCMIHPMKKHTCFRNEFTEYAADMNLLLAYYNLMDDWQDEKKKTSYVMTKMLKRSCEKVIGQYPRQAEAVKEYLRKIHKCEQENSGDLDLAAGLTGEALGELYVYKEDIWSDELRELGFYLGKFIYLMDAYEDLKKDQKNGNYNPFRFISEDADYEEKAKTILTMMAASASKAFEKLPILEHVDILRNILYTGIWSKYDMVRRTSDS